MMYKETEQEQPELEQCPFCGIWTENPCDSLPPDYCEQAINTVFLRDVGNAF